MDTQLLEKVAEYGIFGILGFYLIKYLTGDLKQELRDLKGEIKSLYEIIVKLIDKTNDLKDTVSKKWKE